MKTLSVALSFCLSLIAWSCSNASTNSSKAEKLYIKTTTATETGPNISDIQKTEVISEITTDYFEVSLESQSDGGYYAQKDIVKAKVGEPFKSVFFQISRKDGTLIKFMTTTEFLNFMSAHGYDLVNQIPNEYGGDYTFKKK